MLNTRFNNGSVSARRRARNTVRRAADWVVENLEDRVLLSTVTSGFANFTLNGGGPVSGSQPSISTDNTDLTITQQAGSIGASAFNPTKVPFQNFTTTFMYQQQFGEVPPADGFTFALQNQSATAVGGSGGSLGYNAIKPSFAVEFNIYQGSKTGVGTNGSVNASIDTGGLHLDNYPDNNASDPIEISLTYNTNSQQLTELLKDATRNLTYSRIFTGINLGSILGGSTAWIGFTGGTGGAYTQQDIWNFTFQDNPTPPPPAGSYTGFNGFTLTGADGAGAGGSAVVSNNHGAAPALTADFNTLTLTTAATQQASSVITSSATIYQNFAVNFNYQATGGTNPAGSGFAFILENDSRGAGVLGGGGADLGYAQDPSYPAIPISPSFAAEFSLGTTSSVAIATNSGAPVSSTPTGQVNLGSGDLIKVNLNYSGSALTETLTDTVTNKVFTTTFSNLNLPVMLGSNSAFAGLTGSTSSSADAKQVFTNFSYAPNSSVRATPVGSTTGFGNWTLNGANGAGLNSSDVNNNNNGTAPAITADSKTLTITTASNSEASSAWFNVPVTYQNFTAGFTYTDVSTGGADGFTFTLQNDPRDVNAIGEGGGAIGIGSNPAGNVTNSFAAEFNIYQVSSVTVGTGGGVNTLHNIRNTGAVDIRSGHPINVLLQFNSANSTMLETLTDANTKATYSTTYTNINLGNILAGSNAYLGFTGGTGGANALQTITGFTYSTNATTVPPTPVMPTPVNSVNGTTGGFANFNMDGSNAAPGGIPGVSADNNTLTLTTANNNEATTVVYSQPVTYGNFNANFIYTGTGGADGFNFILENSEVRGGAGGSTGYGNSVPNSFAAEFNIYQNTSLSIGAGGSVSGPHNHPNMGSVNLTSGDPINIQLAYNSSAQTLTETLTDTTTQGTYSTTWNNLNLWQILGGSPGTYVGFSGGTGGANALQQITNFTYTATPATAIPNSGPQVSLAGYFSNYGIDADGSAVINGGFDGSNALSNTFFGTSKAITLNGVTQTFNFGASGLPNSINAAGQVVNLPQGHYGSITMVAGAVNGTQNNQPFTVVYTDGTYQTFNQSLSDWFFSGKAQSGESVAVPMNYRLNGSGAQINQGATIDAYEYQFKTDATKTVQSIALPNDGNVRILAMNVNVPPAVTVVNPTSGSTAGGNTVTITGTNLGSTGVTAVNFGTVAGTNVTVAPDGNSLTVTAPAEAAGAVDVTVTTPLGGTSATSSADQYTYSASVPPTLVGVPVINGDDPNGLFTAAGQPANGKQRSMVEDIVYTFNEPVTITDANAAFKVLVAGPAGGTVPTTLFAQAVAGSNGTQWAVSLTGQAEGILASIANGEYSIQINPAGVFAAADGTTAMAAGTGRTDKFFRLFGDIDGNESVSTLDYGRFKQALAGAYNPAFDYDGNGSIATLDYGRFKQDMPITYFGDGFVTTI
jgi:hypothetical protein